MFKCSINFGSSLWENMGSPWKGFVEFTLPASPPTAFVSADLSSTSPVGLSLSPYGQSVSFTFPLPFLRVPPTPSNTHPPTLPCIFPVNGLIFLFGLPRLASTRLYRCRVGGASGDLNFSFVCIFFNWDVSPFNIWSISFLDHMLQPSENTRNKSKTF